MTTDKKHSPDSSSLNSASLNSAALTRELVSKAASLVPKIRERSTIDEQNRVVSEDTINELEALGFFEALVPKAYGGQGLGLSALYQVARTLARGDASTAWISAFLIQHNWWACRLPKQVQKELYADKTHVKIAACHGMASATPVEGGYRISGKYPYCSGIKQAEFCLFPANLMDEGKPSQQPPIMYLVPVKDVKVLDDWYMTGMAASASCTVLVEDVFVPEYRSTSVLDFWGSRHFGLDHEEPIFRTRIMESVSIVVAAVAVGAAEAMLDWAREKLSSSAPNGIKRIDRTPSQMRWGQAAQKVRMATALFDTCTDFVLDKEATGEAWSEEDMGQTALDVVTIIHTCKEALQMLVDGLGSSGFNRDLPLQRALRDIQMLGTHVLAGDIDVLVERGTRLVLGLGFNEIDPPVIP